MDWVKLVSGYYLDPAVATLPDADAEVLFLRSVAYCGSAETGGVVSEAVLPSLVRGYSKAKARRLAEVLCETVPRPLWIRVENGWQIRSWENVQADLEALLQRRRSDRKRQAAARARQRTASRDFGRDSHGTERRGREEKTAAAAADARGGGGVSPIRPTTPGSHQLALHDLGPTLDLDDQPVLSDLPPAVEILRGKLDNAGLTVRWDDLDDDQLLDVVALVVMHGDAALVAAAQRSRAAHSAPPAYARAWLPVWHSMPDPAKRRLAAVPEPRCSEDGHQTEPARTCRMCAGDQKAGIR